MGLDVQIYAKCEPTEELAQAIRDKLGDFAMVVHRVRNRWNLDTDNYRGSLDTNDAYIEVVSMHRYFGPGYARGHWPTIKDAILKVQDLCPPGTKVLYGQDCSDFGVPVDDEYLAELDAVYDSLK